MLQKKSISSVIFALSALSLSTIAIANGGGYGVAPVAPAPMPMSEASFYIGVGGGYANTHWDNIYQGGAAATSALAFDPVARLFVPPLSVTYNKIKDTGFAGRIFAGYNFNRYIAIEGGWTYLPRASFNSTTATGAFTTTGLRVNVPIGATAANTSARISNYAFDLLAKVTAPLSDGFSIFGKLGLGYLHSKASGNLAVFTTTPLANSVPASSTVVATTVPFTFADGRTTHSHWGPVFGAGVGYDITPNLVIDASWMRYSGNGKVLAPTTFAVNGATFTTLAANGKYQPSPDVALLSISYKFPVNM